AEPAQGVWLSRRGQESEGSAVVRAAGRLCLRAGGRSCALLKWTIYHRGFKEAADVFLGIEELLYTLAELRSVAADLSQVRCPFVRRLLLGGKEDGLDIGPIFGHKVAPLRSRDRVLSLCENPPQRASGPRRFFLESTFVVRAAELTEQPG